MTVPEILQGAASALSEKLGGLSHVLQNYNAQATRDRDNGDVRGVGLLLEGLSDDAASISELLDCVNEVDPELDIPGCDEARDPVGVALVYIRTHKGRALG